MNREFIEAYADSSGALYMPQHVKLADLMKKNRIGNVVVLDRKKPVGIVTERDLVERVIASDRNPRTTKIARIMSKPLITTKPDSDVFEASAILSKKNIRRLPVVQGGRLVGIITERDVTKSLYEHFNRVMSVVLDIRENNSQKPYEHRVTKNER